MQSDSHLFDPDDQCKLQEQFPLMISKLTLHERNALAAAATRRLALIDAGPDEYGYDPHMNYPSDDRRFLEAVAESTIYE
ncbi:hypothetical protein [Rhodopirellula baltica]